jgi:hypothetical protein
LAATTMRGETLVDVNRGRIRGWSLIAAIFLAVLALLSWPFLLGVVVLSAAAAVCVGVAVWVHRALPDVDKESTEEGPSDTGRDD